MQRVMPCVMDGHAMWVACNRTRFPATWPCVFCELKSMKIVILIYQIIQEKFAYGDFFMLVMIENIFMFRMVKKMQNSGLKIVAGLTLPLKKTESILWWKLNQLLSVHFFPN